MRMRLPSVRSALQTLQMTGCLVLAVLMSGCCCTNGWIMNNSGMGYYQKGNYSMARGEFQRAVMDSPKNPDYRHNLAMAMQKQGDMGGAETVLRHNLSVDPMHQPTYHALTTMLISQQRQGEAGQMLAEWRETQPYVPEAYVEQAWFQHETGDRLAAEQTLRQALQIKPNHPAALAQLGQIYHEGGQSDQAAAYYQRSLQARWDQPEVRSRLATVSGGNSASMRRAAMIRNDAVPVMAASQPVSVGPPMMVQTMPGDMVAMDGRSRRRHRHVHMQGSPELLTAYPLPSYGMADAGGFTTGMITAETPVYSSGIASSPTILPEATVASQPTLATPTIASAPTPILQADPAHATPMTASLPVVDPY